MYTCLARPADRATVDHVSRSIRVCRFVTLLRTCNLHATIIIHADLKSTQQRINLYEVSVEQERNQFQIYHVYICG